MQEIVNNKELEGWARKAGDVHVATTKQYLMPMSGPNQPKQPPTFQPTTRSKVGESEVSCARRVSTKLAGYRNIHIANGMQLVNQF